MVVGFTTTCAISSFHPTITGRENMLEYYLKPLSQSIPLQKTSKISEFGWRSVLFVEKSGVPRENH
jgi:hypothetical protein